MSEAFNTIWVLIQGFFWLGFLALAIMVVIMILTVAWREMVKIMLPKTKAHREVYLKNARAVAMDRFRGQDKDEWATERGFMQGAEWAWDTKYKPKP